MNQHVTRPGKSERTPYGVTLTEPQPLSDIPTVWRLGALVSTQVMGALAVVAALYLGRSILLPVAAGLIVGVTLAPAVTLGSRLKIPQPVSAMVVVLLLMILIGMLVGFFAAPLSEWIARAPEIGGVIREKLRVLNYPLSIFHDLKNAVTPAGPTGPTVSVESNPAEMVAGLIAVVTPAVSQFVLFFGTMVFFLATNATLRQKLIVAFWTRDARLRMIRIWNDIEHNLVSYVGLVSVINVGLGVVTGLMLYLVGFPNPVTFGLLISLLNYIPYIGPAIFTVVLFCVGLIAMPTLGQAVLAPALFVAIATLEGHFVTPSLVGRRLTISPFLVFLALAFWTWLWGPIGAFLAMPLLIVGFVVLGHLLPSDEGTLPG